MDGIGKARIIKSVTKLKIALAYQKRVTSMQSPGTDLSKIFANGAHWMTVRKMENSAYVAIVYFRMWVAVRARFSLKIRRYMSNMDNFVQLRVPL